MKTCKDCSNPTETNNSLRCISCKKALRVIVQKSCKTKYQYHKQPKTRYNVYKRGALRRGYSFNITIEQFNTFWDTSCHYCNEPIKGIGIDRIDNTIGYVHDNLISCCTLCNFMKHNTNYKEFIDRCIKISNNFLS
jgi:hypothetical protein